MDMNMDIKDVLAKFKKKGDGKGAKGKKGGNPFVAFFENNPKMKIILPLILLLIAATVAVVFIVSGVKTDADVTQKPGQLQGEAVNVMPMLERPKGDALVDGANPFDEDAIANARLKGTLYNPNGYYTAIVETKTHSYILQTGDYVANSDWLVDKIKKDSVTFSMGDKTRVIEMKKD